MYVCVLFLCTYIYPAKYKRLKKIKRKKIIIIYSFHQEECIFTTEAETTSSQCKCVLEKHYISQLNWQLTLVLLQNEPNSGPRQGRGSNR